MFIIAINEGHAVKAVGLCAEFIFPIGIASRNRDPTTLFQLD